MEKKIFTSPLKHSNHWEKKSDTIPHESNNSPFETVLNPPSFPETSIDNTGKDKAEFLCGCGNGYCFGCGHYY